MGKSRGGRRCDGPDHDLSIVRSGPRKRSGLGGCVRRGGVLAGGGLRQQFLLPLGQRLGHGLGLGVRVGALPCAGLQALGDGGGDDLGEQSRGTDRVVVARDRVVDEVGIAVGVQDRDDRDVQLAGLGDGEVLLAERKMMSWWHPA